jgi:hypothetical protein
VSEVIILERYLPIHKEGSATCVGTKRGRQRAQERASDRKRLREREKERDIEREWKAARWHRLARIRG